ncbi:MULTISPECIES: polysaccharide biosynthesis tyrosine autokinase [Burkholderia]|uniref:polysaccharide biosynthesis tyrosine autokinase n=1 Tax=Burkholderia TaxID=32008 RepID=UPI000BF8DAA6|nr:MULTISPECIES: polysaccharide biosynthesis tyrosine autokinase [Burkholderia]PFH20848.1 tyrosine-protein kinase Etk/Wzc [Burkholderia sp. JKS000303]
MKLEAVNRVPQLPGGDPSPDDGAELGALLDIFLENRRMIALVTAVCLALGGLYALLRPRVYEGNLLIQVENSIDSAANSLLGSVSSLFDVKSTADAEIELIRSRLVVTRAVDSTRLFIYAKPHYVPLIGRRIAAFNKGLSEPGLFGWGGFCWGSESIEIDTFDVPTDDEADKFRITLLDQNRYRLSGADLAQPVIGRIGELLSFSTVDGPARLQVRGITGRPGAAFDVIRYSRLQTIDDLQDRMKITELGKQSGVISVVWQNKDPALVSEVMNAVGREYVQQNIGRKSEEAERSIAFLNSQLPVMKRDLELAEDRFNAMRNKLGTVNLGDEAGLMLQQSVDIDTQLIGLKQRREELMSRFGPSHPAMVALNDQIQSLNSQLGALDTKIRSRPMVEQSILRLTRDVQVSQGLYVAMLNNVQQLKLLKAGKVGTVRLVDTAVVPDEPVKPKAWIDLAVSLVLGLSLGGGCAFLRSTMFGGVTNPDELEQRTGLSVYSVVPHSARQTALQRKLRTNKSDTLVLSNVEPRDPSVESLRSLRTAMQFAMLDAVSNVVVISGPTPGVGKSFVSSNLAAVLANAGSKVLLIDADMRKGHLHYYFGIDRESGFSELLAGQRQIGDVRHSQVLPNLDFIATGTLPPNPNELLLTTRLPALLAEFSRDYDVVVIDTPPVLATADTGVLAQHAGAVFLVAKAGMTNVAEIRESSKRLAQAGTVPKGVVFNGLKAHLGKYGYGAKYGVYRYSAYEYVESETA